MKVKLGLQLSGGQLDELKSTNLEYMDTQPFIQGTDSRNKIYVYINKEVYVNAANTVSAVSISYLLQNGRSTIRMSNTSMTEETISGVVYKRYQFDLPATVTALSGNIQATIYVHYGLFNAKRYDFKYNVINTVMESNTIEVIEDALSDTQSEILQELSDMTTAIQNAESNITDLDSRVDTLESHDTTQTGRIDTLNQTVYGNSDGTTTSSGLTSKVLGLELDNVTNKGDIVDIKGDIVNLNAKDVDLQAQIDGINAGQNLADIVADLSALNSLSTTNLKSGDKVQVLVDSNHDNGSTVYNWNGTSWVYVGKYGQDGYTKAEDDALLNLKADKSTVNAHIANTSNPHSVTKAQVGLGNCDNTSDENKPVSTAQQAALDLKADKSTTYTKTETDYALGLKQNATIDAITVNGVDYTNIESAVDAINDFMEVLNEEIGAIDGSGDTSLAERITELESEVTSLNNTWEAFTEETSADDIINTLVEIQNEFKKLDILVLPYVDVFNSDDASTVGTLTQTQFDSITPRTTIVLKEYDTQINKVYEVYKVNFLTNRIGEGIRCQSIVDNTVKELYVAVNLNYYKYSYKIQKYIDTNNKLSSDLVSDTNKTNKFVTPQEKTFITNKFNKNANVFNAYNLDLKRINGNITYGSFSVINENSINATLDSTNHILSMVYPITYVENDSTNQYKLRYKISDANVNLGIIVNGTTYNSPETSGSDKVISFNVLSGTTYIEIYLITSQSVSSASLTDIMLQYPDYNSVDTFVPYSKVEQMTDQDVENIDNALYNINEYDSKSGNVITRQTGFYICSGGESWSLYHDEFWYATINGLVDSNPLVCSNGIVAVCHANNQIRVYLSSNPSITTSSDLNSIFNYGVKLEYKLATSYTEQVIENTPLLDLPQDGCNYVRSEWEKSLNEFSAYKWTNITGQASGSTWTINSANSITLTYATAMTMIYGNYQLKPYTTYTFSFVSSSQSATSMTISCDGTAYDSNAGETSLVFTTGSTGVASIRFFCNSATTITITNIMLNKGTHAYPYQEYNGAIVREKDLNSYFVKQRIVLTNGSHLITSNVDYVVNVGYEDSNGNIDYFTKPTGFSVYIDSGNQLNYYLDSSLNLANKVMYVIYKKL